MKFIEVIERTVGNKIAVNLNSIMYFYEDRGYCTLVLDSGYKIETQHSYSAVAGKIDNAIDH